MLQNLQKNKKTKIKEEVLGMYLNKKSMFQKIGEFLYSNSGAIMSFAFCLVSMSVFGGATEAFADASEVYGGDTQGFIDKSVLTIKIVRFIAIFIVIAGIVWAGAEFAIKHDQQRGANILVSAVIGGFAVLLAPTLVNFVIGGLGLGGGEITNVGK